MPFARQAQACYNISMIDFVSLGIVLLAGMVHATLQLGLGCLLLLYHASLGKHVREKTRNLVGSFISGIGLMVILSLGAACFLIGVVFGGSLNTWMLIVAISVMLMLAIIMWFFYYRRGRATELWVPKIIAKYIDNRAKVTESNTEAFSLGLLAGFAEMPFTLVLIMVSANGILALPQLWQGIIAVVYTVMAISPMVVMRYAIRRGKTVVDIQRWRVKNKTFLKVISGIGFAVLGCFMLAFQIMGK